MALAKLSLRKQIGKVHALQRLVQACFHMFFEPPSFHDNDVKYFLKVFDFDEQKLTISFAFHGCWSLHAFGVCISLLPECEVWTSRCNDVTKLGIHSPCARTLDTQVT